MVSDEVVGHSAYFDVVLLLSKESETDEPVLVKLSN